MYYLSDGTPQLRRHHNARRTDLKRNNKPARWPFVALGIAIPVLAVAAAYLLLIA